MYPYSQSINHKKLKSALQIKSSQSYDANKQSENANLIHLQLLLLSFASACVASFFVVCAKMSYGRLSPGIINNQRLINQTLLI